MPSLHSASAMLLGAGRKWYTAKSTVSRAVDQVYSGHASDHALVEVYSVYSVYSIYSIQQYTVYSVYSVYRSPSGHRLYLVASVLSAATR